MTNVLWIEDGAEFELASLAAPVFVDGQYDLYVASNITAGLGQLSKREYRVVIVDIRLPPGEDLQWTTLYKKAGQQKSAAALGLKLLKSVLGADAEVKLKTIPAWLTPDRIGVFTVERFGDLKESLDALDIRFFRQKTADMPPTALLDLIKQIHTSSDIT